MHRRLFMTTLAAATFSGGAAFALNVQDEIIDQLTAQGFTKVVVSRTLLGRLRFVATNDIYRREIVINPNTGEVLRDYLVVIATGQPPARINISSPPDPDDDGDDDSAGGDGDSDGDGGDGGGDGGGGDDGGDSGGGTDGGDSGDDSGGTDGGDSSDGGGDQAQDKEDTGDSDGNDTGDSGDD